MHCELVVFCIFRYPPQIRSGSQNGGNSPAKIWLRYNIFRKSTLLWALQNLIFRKNIARVLMKANLADFIRCFCLNVWQKPQTCRNIVWNTKNIFNPCAKIALMIGFSDKQLVEHLNGTYTTRCSAES